MKRNSDSSLKTEDLSLLEALSGSPSDWHGGLRIGRAAGLAPGLMYPPLARLERMGALESKWEDVPDGGKPRRLYRITGVGLRIASEAAQPFAKRRQFRLPRLGFPEGRFA